MKDKWTFKLVLQLFCSIFPQNFWQKWNVYTKHCLILTKVNVHGQQNPLKSNFVPIYHLMNPYMSESLMLVFCVTFWSVVWFYWMSKQTFCKHQAIWNTFKEFPVCNSFLRISPKRKHHFSIISPIDKYSIEVVIFYSTDDHQQMSLGSQAKYPPGYYHLWNSMIAVSLQK